MITSELGPGMLKVSGLRVNENMLARHADNQVQKAKARQVGRLSIERSRSRFCCGSHVQKKGFQPLAGSIRKHCRVTNAVAPIASGEEPDAEQVEYENANGNDTIQATLFSRDRSGPSSIGTADMMRLFNDAQQNMLYLNKQRLVAMEELQKAERDRELLLARVGMLEAETQAAHAERDLLEGKVKAAEAAVAMAESRGGSPFQPGDKKKAKGDPPSIWSSLLLRIDSMLLSGAINGGQALALRGLAWNRDLQAAEVYDDMQDRDDRQLASGLLKLLDGNRRRGIHVVHICTEMAPVAQAGSLGTYITELCRALRRKGHMVEVILPKYATLDMQNVEGLTELKATFDSFFNGQMHRNKIWTGMVYGIPVTFIDPQHQNRFFARDKLYDFEDDFERFVYFSRASLDYLLRVGKQPDVLHLHNWQTALVAPLFWDVFANQVSPSQGMGNTRLVFTVHDFKYQHKQDPQKLQLCGLDPGQLNRPDRLQDNNEPNLVNLVKGGIVYSNKVTTVSQIYAHDLKSREQGQGLDATLVAHQSKFLGVLSGLNETVWNPAKDSSLPASFSHEDLTGKAVCKAELRQRLDLPIADDNGYDRPLVGCIAPSVSEVELELVKGAMECALSKGAQFVFIGASRVPRVQAVLEDLERELEDRNGSLVIKYDGSRAHLLVGGADILVCPCIYDPANELPLAGLKYGAIPVARQLPNNPDCVIDVDDQRRGKTEGNGFTFATGRVGDLANALSRAIDRKNNDPRGWEALVKRAMSADFSWDAQASDAYIDAYWSIRGR